MIVYQISHEPVRNDDLVGGERDQAQRLRAAKAPDWRRGRAALKCLLGADYDTSTLAFPHPALSLTHAGGIAIAAWSATGVGVDYEPLRTINPRAARLFLTPAEFEATCEDDWLRLWTVKEAMFKCDADNRGRWLASYVAAEPAARSGHGVRDAAQFRYTSTAAFGGWLTFAQRTYRQGEDQ